ncbi:reticulon-3-like, partial [Ochotona princeps]|uniref:reticulon-3-like n=1 Tax=Ochotona princeps TaxID=9978 RepID=UPI0027151A8A
LTIEELHSIGSNEPPAEIMASSCISSSETCNTDLTTFHGEGEVLGGHPVLAHEDKAHWALPAPREVPKPQGTSSCGADAPGAHRDHPSIPVSSQERPALLLKEVGQLEQQIKTDESEKLNEVAERKAAVESGSGGRFTLLTAQTPPAACSLSPSEASGGGSMEKDSPGSPFEVILDKAAFDKEFKDSYKESMKAFGSWAGHADEESPADKLESDDKVFPLRSEEAGRYPASALLARQFSHTTAALEEVSRCVSDMHNFTNEVLTWDLDPHVKQSTDKSSDHNTKTGPDVNKCQPDIPVVHLKTKIHQKIPVCSFSGNTSITKPTGDDLAEISLPQENARPAHASSVKDTRGSEQKQDDTLSELSRSPSEKPVPLGPGAVLPEVDWQNPGVGEVAEADSSGESDDTVIEDIAAGASAEDYKVQMESPGSIPSAVANTGGRAVQELSACRREGKTSEDPEEGVCTSEPHPAQPHVPGRKLLGEVAPSQVPDVSVPEEGGKPSGNVAEAAPQMPVTTEKQKLPVGISAKVFSETDVTSYTYSTPFLGKDVKDMDDSSPEDLITAFTKTRGKGTVGAGETKARDSASQKTTGCKASLPAEALPGSEPGPSDVEGVKRRRSEQAEGVSGSKCQDAVPAQSVPAASPDLEQEQLTIQALKELGERQAEMSAATPGEETARRTVAPGAWPRRSCAIPEQTGVSPASGPDPGIPKRPAVTQEASRVDNGSSLSTTELVNTHALARLLADFSGNDSQQKSCMWLILCRRSY